MTDFVRLREEFPALRRQVHGHRLAYLDNVATAHKPQAVIDAMNTFYTTGNSNVHRGVHTLSVEATVAYDAARAAVARFIGAPHPDEVIFTAGTTASINLVAQAWGGANLAPGDEILLTEMEHHSNIVPWQLIAERTGAVVRAARVDDTGTLDLEHLAGLLSPRTKVVALAHISNVLGTVNPVAELARMAHAHGAIVVVDGAQGVAHGPVNMTALGADFYAFSAHKMYGPTGVGVLWGRRALLGAMGPWQGGGGMIDTVTFERTTWAPVPARFEAGTPPIAEVLGLHAAVTWLEGVGMAAIAAHEEELLRYAMEQLAQFDGLRVIGTAPGKAAVIAFTLGDVHPHDIGQVLDSRGVAIRVGHHCAQPLMRRFGVAATARAGFAVYNSREDVDALVSALHALKQVFA